MNKENRSFSRVPTRIRAYFRIVPSIKKNPMVTAQPATLGLADLDLDKVSNFPPPVLNALQVINAKLDLLIGYMSQSGIQEDYPLRAEVVEISAAGIKMSTDQPLKKGDFIEIVLLLSRQPFQTAVSFGQVMRKEQLEDEKVWVISFRNLRESDRETIIRFVFQEQRQQIRRDKDEF